MERLLEEKGLCLLQDSKDGANLVSCRREFWNLGTATEKALSPVSPPNAPLKVVGLRERPLLMILIPRQAQQGRHHS